MNLATICLLFVEEEEFAYRNATSAAAAANADVSNEDLPDAPGISHDYRMPDLVEVDSDSDDKDDDDDNDHSVITGVPISNRPSASTTRNSPPTSNIPSDNTLRKVPLVGNQQGIGISCECPYQFQRLLQLQLRGPSLARRAYQFLLRSPEEHMLTQY